MEGGSAPPSARPRKVPALRRRDRREPTFARAIAGCAGAIIRHQPAGQPGPRSPELVAGAGGASRDSGIARSRSEEHTSELQSLMRISYAVFCLQKKNTIIKITHKEPNMRKN